VSIPTQDIHIHFWNKNSLLVQKSIFVNDPISLLSFDNFFLDKKTLPPEKCTFGKILERWMLSKFPNLARKLT